MAEIVPTVVGFTGPMTPDGDVKDGAKPALIGMGLLVLAWNDMQEKLAELFWAVSGIPNGLLPLNIWHSLRDDRTQRAILRTALNTGLAQRRQAQGKDGPKWLKKATTNINWLLDAVNDIANDRNNFVHAPFVFSVKEDGSLEMTPFDFFRNPRAKALKGRALYDEMACHRQNMAVLGTFAISLKFTINHPEEPWPKKPRVLSVEEFRRQKEIKRRPKSGGQPPLPSAS